jgi:hypothetical protein
MTDSSEKLVFDPTETPEGELYIAAMNLSTGQTIYCDQIIDVEWDKPAGMGADYEGQVKLDCSCKYHQANPNQLPQPLPAIDMLPCDISEFTLSHPPGTGENNITVTATITMTIGLKQYSYAYARQVNLQCDMPGAPAGPAALAEKAEGAGDRRGEGQAAAAKAAKAPPKIILPATPPSFRLVPKRDNVIFGQFRAAAGDMLSAAILETGQKGDKVLAELVAQVRPGPTPHLKSWFVAIPAALLSQKCNAPRVGIQLTLWRAGQRVFTETVLTFVLCDPNC